MFSLPRVCLLITNHELAPRLNFCLSFYLIWTVHVLNGETSGQSNWVPGEGQRCRRQEMSRTFLRGPVCISAGNISRSTLGTVCLQLVWTSHLFYVFALRASGGGGHQFLQEAWRSIFNSWLLWIYYFKVVVYFLKGGGWRKMNLDGI